jgi:hypothetical protein
MEARNEACESCGSFEALDIAGKFLCADCVALAGSSCAGTPETDEG